jgi:hypothetical protein
MVQLAVLGRRRLRTEVEKRESSKSLGSHYKYLGPYQLYDKGAKV